MAETRTLRGVVRGRTIELEVESGIPDGQPVLVRLEASSGKASQTAFGAWADAVATCTVAALASLAPCRVRGISALGPCPS